jgi:hypothetical protein
MEAKKKKKKKKKILASFIGSHAWVLDQVADSLALIWYLEKLLIWLIMTTNPNWPEICS